MSARAFRGLSGDPSGKRVHTVVWLKPAREELRCGVMHLKATASCAMLFREPTAMLAKPVMGHSLQGHPKLKLPLVDSR